jgi:hypothetical protein
MIKCSNYTIQATYLNNVRREAGVHFRNKMKEYLKAKIDVIETNSKGRKSETCIGASMILKMVTSLELIE